MLNNKQIMEGNGLKHWLTDTGKSIGKAVGRHLAEKGIDYAKSQLGMGMAEEMAQEGHGHFQYSAMSLPLLLKSVAHDALVSRIHCSERCTEAVRSLITGAVVVLEEHIWARAIRSDMRTRDLFRTQIRVDAVSTLELLGDWFPQFQEMGQFWVRLAQLQCKRLKPAFFFGQIVDVHGNLVIYNVDVVIGLNVCVRPTVYPGLQQTPIIGSAPLPTEPARTPQIPAPPPPCRRRSSSA
jgi:hypothetical protein